MGDLYEKSNQPARTQKEKPVDVASRVRRMPVPLSAPNDNPGKQSNQPYGK